MDNKPIQLSKKMVLGKSTPSQTAGNLFGPISTDAPPSLFPRVSSTIKVPNGVFKSGPIQTNNFWGNITLADQSSYVFTHPYVVWRSTAANFQGLAISHQAASQRIFGPNDDHGAPRYYYSASGVMSLVLGSSDFDSGFSMSLNNLKKMSIDVTLKSAHNGYLTAPLLQGIGLVTAVYNDLIPSIHSQVGFKSVSGDTAPKAGIDKYRLTLNDGSIWFMYVTFTDNQKCQFALKDPQHIIGSNSINNCWIQVCCGDFSDYDKAAGCYPIASTISASTSGTTGTYALNYTTAGSGTTPMFYALPHHVQSFTSKMKSKRSNATLSDTVHGDMVGYLTNIFEMSETIPNAVSLHPWSSISEFSGAKYTNDELNSIRNAALKDVNNDVSSLSNVDSMYFSGKILDKFAYVLYTLHFILKDEGLTKPFLEKMKTAIARFRDNKQIFPLCYETNWGGICSTGGMANGDAGVDFGNNIYNDHHFHYAYHIHAAAIVAKVDQEVGDGLWIENNRIWIETLLRDVANPSESDTHFPVFRNFDFFIGHSFAHGITVYADGKDQESGSEDYNFAYAMKIWAQVIKDSNMESRANLMLGILKRSMNNYYLYASDNAGVPAQFRGNLVSGIKFENKIDHTTYFGTNPEYIHGIQMIPITPISSFIRTPNFVKEEWDKYLGSKVNGVNSGWKGILMLNYALYDPKSSYNFFNTPNFNYGYLDDGMTLTWSLAYTAGVSS